MLHVLSVSDLEKEKNADVEVYICVRFTVVFPIFMSSNTIVMCVTSPSYIKVFQVGKFRFDIQTEVIAVYYYLLYCTTATLQQNDAITTTILLYFIWIPNSCYDYNNLLYSNGTTAKVQHFCCTQKMCTSMLLRKCRTC